MGAATETKEVKPVMFAIRERRLIKERGGGGPTGYKRRRRKVRRRAEVREEETGYMEIGGGQVKQGQEAAGRQGWRRKVRQVGRKQLVR